jgi:copper chaperone CopZ
VTRSTFAVPEIVCEGCAASIRKALEGLPGVTRVDVDVSGKQVRVEFDEAHNTADGVQARIEAAGFDVASSG